MTTLHQFYIIIPIGSEEKAWEEILLWDQVFNQQPRLINLTKGGLLIEAPLSLGLKLTYALKIPVRVLLRLTQFKARDFPSLYQKCTKLSWNKWLGGPDPDFSITCHESRLMHTDRIKNTMTQAVEDYLKHHPLKKKWSDQHQKQKFYVRLQNDELVLSLDLAGLPLYKRGIQPIKASAPIRENLASWLLWELTQDLTGDAELIDPMCGSGTFLFEALNLHRMLDRPMSFQSSPLQLKIKMQDRSPTVRFTHFMGFDLDEKTISHLTDVSSKIIFQTHDIFKHPTLPTRDTSGSRLVICNPPYGVRIKAGAQKNYFESLWSQLMLYHPQKLLMVIPEKRLSPFLKKEASRMIRFKNGGLSVVALIKSQN